MKILLIGANGQLGTDLSRALAEHQHEVAPTTLETLDIVKMEQVRETFQRYEPDLIINTAAFTAVDACETETLAALAVNAYGVRNVALAAKEIDAVVMHFSTDYIFDGKQSVPYRETDAPNPISAYGVSKLAGEHFLRYLWEKHFILRTCGLYGHAGLDGKGKNFIEVMLQKAQAGGVIRVVDDQRVTPTSTQELVRKAVELIETGQYGLYHVTANGDCSWYEFAREIFSIQNLDVQLLPTTQQEFRAAAQRPSYSVLENARLKQVGRDDLKEWQQALREYLATRPPRP